MASINGLPVALLVVMTVFLCAGATQVGNSASSGTVPAPGMQVPAATSRFRTAPSEPSVQPNTQPLKLSNCSTLLGRAGASPAAGEPRWVGGLMRNIGFCTACRS